MKRIFFLNFILIFSLINCNNIENDNRDITTPRNKSVPFISIKSEKKIVDDPKCAAVLKIERNDSLLLETNIGIEIRGAVSQYEDKKSYGFEIRDVNDSLSNKSLLGLPKNDDWILYGPMSDKSFIRNVLTYALSNQMGRYASRTQFVELEINGNYKGVYVLMEKLKQGKQRVAIKKLDKEANSPEKISGGYILKIDKTAGKSGNWNDYNEQSSFTSKYDAKGKLSNKSRIHYLYEYPKSKNITPQQKAYISQYVDNFEKEIASNSSENYQKWIDVDSFVDYFILTEFIQNNDGYRISNFLQKDRDGKLAMGPIWDCDLAYGPENVFCGGMAKDNWVFRYNQFCSSDPWLVPFWWERLLQEPTFKNKVNTRWKSLRKSVLSEENVMKTIDSLTTYLHENNLVDRNYERWSEKKKEGNYKERHLKHIEHIKAWVKQHSAWIDGEIGKI
jgi:CotH kinase protein